MIDKDLAITLKNTGFDDKEARAYLALLELGTAPATAVAKKAELKRSIVYYVLKHLEKKGYVQSVAESKVQKFSAVDPSRILHNVQVVTEELRFMLPLMRALYDKAENRPKIEYFDDVEAIVSIYRQHDREKDARFLTSISRLNKFIPEETESWVHRYKKLRRPMGSRHFVAGTKEDLEWAKRMAESHEEVRILPANTEMSMDFSISGEILSVTSFDPLFIVVIRSKKIAESAAKLFDLAWQVGVEVK